MSDAQSDARAQILGGIRRSLRRGEVSGEARQAVEARLAAPPRGPSVARAQLAQPAKVYWLCIAMAGISTVMPIWLMAEGIKRIGANQVAMIAAIGPVLTIFFGWLILREAITFVQIVGAALVLAGVLVVSLKAEATTVRSA